MTNKKIEKIIQTYKSILLDTNNVNKHNIIFLHVDLLKIIIKKI